jgi:CrcB protein
VTYAWLILGAIAGAPLRYFVGSKVQSAAGGNFAWGTLAVNLTGCFVIGVVATLANEKDWLGREARLLFITGFLGSYTTFSAFGYETYALASGEEFAKAAANVIASVAVGLFAVWLGVLLARSSLFAEQPFWR